ncbi:MAG TPA: ABC transporter ATP-binding protein [Bryobacteraceae bacterium]|nr:ABC transporter ATP-binding protein [Bryobacteraceae bacterium]
MIEVRGLRYAYPDGAVALDGIDFHLNEGETVVLLGANGSGKTTFVLCLAGLLQASSGLIAINGIELTKSTAPELRRELGLVFQDADDQLFLPTVLEDVMFGPLNHGLSRADAERVARESLARTGVRAGYDRPPYHLSAGEKRRVAIAGVLAMNPKVLLLDEPTTYLDPPGQRDLVTILASLPQAKLLVTHDIHFASALGARAVFFDQGRIVGAGTVAEVVERFTWNLR